MTIAPELLGRLCRMKDVCPAFAQASKEYDAAMKAEDKDRAEAIFRRMQLIAQSFWAGVEFARTVPPHAEKPEGA